MVKITPTEISRIYSKAASVAENAGSKASKAGKNASELAMESRELQMIPKYLELASIKGQDRFNSKQITEITEGFKEFETTQSKTDVLKNLLSIGAEKGKPLSSDEIKGFLDVTSGMKKQEQNNVLKFLKKVKEFEEEQISAKDFGKEFTYEKYREKQVELFKGLNLGLPDEKTLRSRYRDEFRRELELRKNKFFMGAIAVNKTPVEEQLLNGRNLPFVRAVAGASDMDALFDIVRLVGVNDNVCHSANALIDVMKATHCLNLITDLSRGFYPAETKQIAELVKKDVKNGKDFETYFSQTIPEYGSSVKRESLSTQRRRVLVELGYNGKIKLLPLERYADITDVSTRVGGNFERGKRR